MKKIFEKQCQHLITLAVLLPCVYAASRIEGFLHGKFLGISTQTWFWLSITVPVIHQIVVIFTWRGQLHYNLMTRWFGDKAFKVWGIGFMALLVARPLSVIGLAIANRTTIPISPLIGITLALICMIPIIYLAYSIHQYFSIERALGIDHFEPEKYKDMPFIRDGIFRWTPNAMYKFGLLVLWVPGLLLLSKSALLSAFFSHIYIWTHYYFTELPDIRHIYGIPINQPNTD
jgi:hypothetical protein